MAEIDRKTFLATAAGAAAAAALDAPAQAAPATSTGEPVFISTWEWGKPATERAAQVLASGGSLLDAVEKGINKIELDPDVMTVGYGGLPNAEGEVELDAGIMDGTTRRAGAVFNLHKIATPISVARLVMENTRHTQLAGEGALRFAIEMGFKPEQLLTPKSLEVWLKWKNTPNHQTFWIDKDHHDTIGLCGVAGGKIVAGCSTSGLQWKIPGRVADSPIVGDGYYADDAAGAAAATGDGDVMSNYCTSFYIVNRMREGAHPQQACEDLLRLMSRTAPDLHTDMYCVIAIDKHGRTGAASMNTAQPLHYVVWRNGSARMYTAKSLL